MGFGRTDKPEASNSLFYFAQIVRDFLDALGIERSALVASAGLGKEVTSLMQC